MTWRFSSKGRVLLRLTGLILLLLVFAVSFCAASRSQQIDPKTSTIEFYIQSAFANKEKILKRFATKDRFDVNVVCSDISCDEITRRLRAYLSPRIFNVMTRDTLSQDLDINILILSDKGETANDSLLSEKIFNVGANEMIFIDGITQCGGMTKRSRDTVKIKQLAVVTVSSGNPLRDTACLILEIIRGSGLSFADDFPTFWKSQEEESRVNAAEFENRMTILSAILSFHFNKHTKAGMSIADTKSILEKQTLEEIRGAN